MLLNATLREQWSYGSNALVGGRPCKDGVAHLDTPALKLFSSVKAHRRIVHSERMMGVRTFANTAKLLLAEPRQFFPPDKRIADQNRIHFSRYTITHTRNRVAFLNDIAEFSLFSPKNSWHK